MSITTAVSGSAAVMRAAAAIPLPGMLMSSRQTSGLLATVPPGAADSASAASAQTRKSPRSSKAVRTMARVRAWSSARRTLIGRCHGTATSTRVPRAGVDSRLRRPPIDSARSLMLKRPKPVEWEVPCEVEPAPVVLDDQPDAVGTLEPDGHLPRGAVLGRIRHRLPQDAEQVLGHVTRDLDVVREVEVHGHVEAGAEVLGRLGDRAGQATGVVPRRAR